MKVKLKKDEKLSSMNNYCRLDYESWASLNHGKEVELDVVPDEIKDKIEGASTSSNSKKGDS